MAVVRCARVGKCCALSCFSSPSGFCYCPVCLLWQGGLHAVPVFCRGRRRGGLPGLPAVNTAVGRELGGRLSEGLSRVVRTLLGTLPGRLSRFPDPETGVPRLGTTAPSPGGPLLSRPGNESLLPGRRGRGRAGLGAVALWLFLLLHPCGREGGWLSLSCRWVGGEGGCSKRGIRRGQVFLLGADGPLL